MTPRESGAVTPPPVTAPDISRTGWESVSDWFEEHFLNSRERT